MKKTKFLVAAGAAILSISGFAAVKLNRQSTYVSTGAFLQSIQIGTASALTSNFTTIASGNHKVFLAKKIGITNDYVIIASLCTSIFSGSKKVYHP